MTPTESLVAASTVTVKDARGRSIAIRKLNALDKMLLSEIVGSDNSLNAVYCSFALTAYAVVSIDGDAVAHMTKAQLEALVKQLDDDGIAAVSKGMTESFGMKTETVDDQREAVKN